MEKCIIVGGGLVGPVLALHLADLGHQVEIYERRPDPRANEVPGGRSINITLCERGFRALKVVDLDEVLKRQGIPARGRIMHDRHGDTHFQPYGNRGEAIYSIARRDIHETVLEHAEDHPQISLHFEQECRRVDFGGPELEFLHRPSGRRHHVRGDRLFACDGAHSAVRTQLLRQGRFNFSQTYVEQGYKEIRLPAAADGQYQLEKEAIHIWPRGRHMLIGFANRDGSFTLALHLPFEGETSFESIPDDASLVGLFERDFPDALPLLPDLVRDFHAHPTTPMVTVRCSPWSYQGHTLLMGDATHAIVPSYGQGVNCGFESCAALRRCLEEADGDWSEAFRAFEEQRRPEAEAIADLALEHFEELQVLVRDEDFLLRKRLERRIEELHPTTFSPLYSMISFTDMPYTEARRRDREQRPQVDALLAMEGIQGWLDTGAADRWIDERFGS